MTRQRYELESPNLHQNASWDSLGWYWKWRSFTLTFKVILTFCLRILGILACPHNNSSQVWARFNKFAPNIHPGMLLAGIENGGHWSWPSRSFWPFWLRIAGNWACPRDKTSQIWDRITKLAVNMHPRILSIGIENEGHRPWPSRSFWSFGLGILGNLACTCLHDNLWWIWARITKFPSNMYLGILAADWK